jgi:type IV pilus assembly protein PilN
MIKINLMKSFVGGGTSESYAAMVSSSDRDAALIQAFKRLVLIILGPLVLYVYEFQALPALEQKEKMLLAEVAETSAFNQSKSGLAAEIKKYEDELNKINAQMAFVNKIARDKINELKLFQHLQYTTPENVWVNKMEFKDNILTMTVESDVPAELDKFSELLTNSGFLSNVTPIGQSIQIDPFGVNVNTVKQDLKAQFMGLGEQ